MKLLYTNGKHYCMMALCTVNVGVERLPQFQKEIDMNYTMLRENISIILRDTQIEAEKENLPRNGSKTYQILAMVVFLGTRGRNGVRKFLKNYGAKGIAYLVKRILTGRAELTRKLELLEEAGNIDTLKVLYGIVIKFASYVAQMRIYMLIILSRLLIFQNYVMKSLMAVYYVLNATNSPIILVARQKGNN